MASDWMPGAQTDRVTGGAMEGQGWRSVVWHTTESGSSPSAIYGVADWVKAQKSEYHLLWNPWTGQFLQLIAAGQSARALKNDGNYRTNRKGTRLIQVSIVGRTADRPLAGGSPLIGWPELRQWLDEQGIPHTDCTASRSRALWQVSGQHTHKSAPGNDHVDPGPIDFDLLYGDHPIATAEEATMIVVRPDFTGTQYLISFNGRAGIANGSDSAELRKALKDPEHIAVISRATWDAIVAAM